MTHTDITTMADCDIAQAIINRDQRVTQLFLYQRCYPLFKAVYDNYYTDCQSPVELINDIYLHLMTPHGEPPQTKMQSFKGASTLTTWVKTVTVFYCYQHYRRKQRVTILEQYAGNPEAKDSDRLLKAADNTTYDATDSMTAHDLEALLKMMPNKRYSELIRLRYIEGLSNEETAERLQMRMDNYYNKHRRARQQWGDILKKEGFTL